MRSTGLSLATIVAAASLTACPPSPNGGGSKTTAPATSGSAPTPSTSTAASAAPSATSSAEPTPEPYQGPSGTLRGTIKITGDEPPQTTHQYPKECAPAVATYGKLFRVGQEGQLADALVAVTHYDGYVPPKEEAVKVTIKDCAYSTRTVALTTGQYIEVKNLDPLTSYIPHLDGARSAATMVAVPRGKAVNVRSRGPGRYWLRDQMGRPFMFADVFHFKYGTTDVTALDGKYEISGIPVGKVQVSVMLPAANLLTLNKETEIKEGDNTLDLTLDFDAEKDVPKKNPGAKDGAKEAPEKK
ncbi:MAG: hypothetical protein JRI68_15240 [Deltaproteobacteria bacterium]|nr:hypothetical protein [Deltaproteobacteria bacterium]